MGAPKKSATRVSEDTDELTRVPLQAILLADSFTTKFRPITLERPKVITFSTFPLLACKELVMACIDYFVFFFVIFI